jgi:ArsR family transcriptional regulator
LDSHLNPELFKALGDPTRLRLLSCLAKCGRPCTVGEVAECCSVDLSVVSRHLAHLADAEVLTATKKGRTVSYQVRFGDLAGALRSLADAIDACCPGTCGPSCECGNAACCGPR